MRSRLMSKANTFSMQKLFVTTNNDFTSHIKVGQCLMDQFDKKAHVQDNITLSYNIPNGHVHIGPQTPKDIDDWVVYKNLHFEHSDCCPSRRSRIHFQEQNKEVELQPYDSKVATCAYIMDQDNNLLITRRPSWLSIFPQAWVLPGGMIDYGESLEFSCLREIEEEIGLTIEPVDENDDNSPFILSNPLQENQKPIPVTMKPYYLYESVTKNVDEIDDHDNETFPPKSSHLVFFFHLQLQCSFKQLTLEFNRAEVEQAVWISLDHLKEAFESKYSDIDGYQMSPDVMQLTEPNCKINTKQLYPLYRYNPYRQGLGKGHYLACQYLLKQYKLI